MEKRNIGFELTIYNSENELSQEEAKLLEKAVSARKKAYSPYSNFQVGAAVLLENGKIVIGNNQENASYPSGLCAERVAVFQAGALFPTQRIIAIAISATSKNYVVNTPAGPCGNCRQSIAEYEQKQKTPIIILMRGEKGKIYKSNSIGELLPLAFNNSFLEDS
ncbi:cytidine deaminase [uncultured Croceitalea sp.]|uniref:cytidine deaminase n=1 Tax=uncultured Croceitalea sp. TaxID=1798908 RepID=UPI00374FA21E